jgi:DNA-binding MarR family transcriptional regulator
MKDIQRTTIKLRILTGMIAKTSIEALENRLREQGINLSHLQFGLLHMVREGPLALTDLSKRFDRAPSTLVPAVDGLEERGLISRERDVEDRRRVHICMTERGRVLMDTLPQVANDYDPLYRAVQAFSEAEVEQLSELLEKLVRNMPDGEEILAFIESRLEIYDSRHKDK